MKTFVFCLSLISIFTFTVKTHAQIDNTIMRIQNCVYSEKVFPEAESPNAILVTSLFEKKGNGVYAYRKKGSHQFNRLAFVEADKCTLVSNDSSSAYIKKEVEQYSLRNNLKSREKKTLQQKVNEFIIDFKESDYLR